MWIRKIKRAFFRLYGKRFLLHASPFFVDNWHKAREESKDEQADTPAGEFPAQFRGRNYRFAASSDGCTAHTQSSSKSDCRFGTTLMSCLLDLFNLAGPPGLLHYMLGAQAGDVGPVFLKNITLWWGCPAILAELTLKAGGVGMIAIGLCYVAAARQGASPVISRRERIAPMLCAGGLIAGLVAAAAGFVIRNIFWPNFYFQPVPTGKNVWLAVQGLSIAIYVVGVCYAFAGIRRVSRQLR